MSVRDDLIDVLGDAYNAWARDPAMEGSSLAWQADAVLAFLGQLDPDADPELIALHLRDSREEIARLREQRDAVLALHSQTVTYSVGNRDATTPLPLCHACGRAAPCPTVRVLTEEVPRG